MKYEEWSNLKEKEDKENPFCTLYEYQNGDYFYIEPIFYTKLQMMFIHHPNKKQTILDKMEEVVKKNHKVIFTGNFENPQTLNDECIILEIEDITDPLNIFVEDKSRGSDYGD